MKKLKNSPSPCHIQESIPSKWIDIFRSFAANFIEVQIPLHTIFTQNLRSENNVLQMNLSDSFTQTRLLLLL